MATRKQWEHYTETKATTDYYFNESEKYSQALTTLPGDWELEACAKYAWERYKEFNAKLDAAHRVCFCQ